MVGAVYGMDIYKLTPHDSGFRLIERADFESRTAKRERWYRTNSSGEGVQYAVCPVCDNPIQIIGLYRLPKHVRAPFGKHACKTIPDLAADDEAARERCPYFKPRQHDQHARKTTEDTQSQKILEILITQFDRVEYILRKQTGIRFSRAKLKSMLETYRETRGHLYTGATVINVPWIFAYMSNATALFKQHVSNNEALTEAVVQKVGGAQVGVDGRVANEPGCWFDLSVSFIHHRYKKDKEEGGLQESMAMLVTSERKGVLVDVYKQVIEFDHQYFQNLIDQSDGQGYRNMELVALAHEVLGDLIRRGNA